MKGLRSGLMLQSVAIWQYGLSLRLPRRLLFFCSSWLRQGDCATDLPTSEKTSVERLHQTSYVSLAMLHFFILFRLELMILGRFLDLLVHVVSTCGAIRRPSNHVGFGNARNYTMYN